MENNNANQESSAPKSVPPSPRAELLQEMRLASEELEQLLRPLDERQLTAPGPGGDWSIKDHIAHLTAWELGIVELLNKRPRFRAMQIEDAVLEEATEDEINAILHSLSRERSLQEVMAEFKRVHQAMLDTLEGMQDEDLLRHYSDYQPEDAGDPRDAPVIGWITGNTSHHYREHAGWIRSLLKTL
jgi:hypothetical protein